MSQCSDSQQHKGQAQVNASERQHVLMELALRGGVCVVGIGGPWVTATETYSPVTDTVTSVNCYLRRKTGDSATPS